MKKKLGESCWTRMRCVMKFLGTLVLLFCISNNIWAQLEGKAVGTSFSGDIFPDSDILMNGTVVRIIDIRNPSYTEGNLVVDMEEFNWDAIRLGQVFGTAINSQTNKVYVAASSVYEEYDYSSDPLAYGTAGYAGIYELDPSSGVVNDLITTADYNVSVMGLKKLPNGTASSPGPGLGNICYDEVHDKLFVTNFEDGKIYRIDVTSGNVDDIYDPLLPDNGSLGFAPLGERPWGLAYNKNENKLYYGVWTQSIWDLNPNLKSVIRSVALDANGTMNGTDQLEIEIPNYYRGASAAAVSDLSFSYPQIGGGSRIAVSTRAMDGSNKSKAHLSRAFLYEKSCESNNQWQLKTTYVVGSDSIQYSGSLIGWNAAGGIDFGYLTYDENTMTNDGCDERIWMTSDAMMYDQQMSGWLYGIHSSPTAGNDNGMLGNYKDIGHFIDFDNTFIPEPGNADGTRDKTHMGDVEVFRSCNIIGCQFLCINTGGDKYICPGEQVQIGSTNCASGGTPPYNYTWIDMYNNVISNTCTANVIPSQNNEGYQLTITDANGCSKSEAVFVYFHDQPEVDAGVNQYACSGQEVVLGGNPTIQGGTAPYIIDWSANLGDDPDDILNPIVYPTVTTVYAVNVIDANGCEDTDQMQVNISPSPEIHMNDEMNLCAGDYGYASPYVAGNNNYKWIPSTGLSCPTCLNPKFTPTETTIYCLEATNSFGCKDTKCITVYVHPLPIADAGEDKLICIGDNVVIGGIPTADGGTPGYNYSWTCTGATTSNPTISPSTNTTCKVTVTDSRGCKATDQMNVSVASNYEYIANNGFSQGIEPDWRSQLDEEHTNNTWFASAGGPDLFDSRYTNCLPDPLPDLGLCGISPLDINCVGIPCNHFGNRPHRSATSSSIDRYAGLYFAINTSDVDPPSFSVNGYNVISDLNFIVEGIEQELKKPLTKGRNYCIDFHAALAQFGEVSDILMDDEAYFTVKLSNGPSTSGGIVNINGTPLLPYTPANGTFLFGGKVTDVNNWENINYQFTASEDFTHVIIETTHPQDLEARIEEMLASGVDPNLILEKLNVQSYFYIDDVSITEVGCCGRSIGGSSLVAYAGEDKLICPGGNCVIIGETPGAIGGNPGYSYLWSTGATTETISVCPTSTTTYSLTVTDQIGNTDTDNITVVVDNNFDLVSNGKFTFGSSPTMRDELSKASSWSVVTGTPDLFYSGINCITADDPNCVDIPNNYFGSRNHIGASIQKYSGLYFAEENAIDRLIADQTIGARLDKYTMLVEGMQNEFSQSTFAGATYNVSCNASIAEYGEIDRLWLGNVQTASVKRAQKIELTFKLSEEPLASIDYQPSVGGVIIHKEYVSDDEDWENISFTYTDVNCKNFKYLIIETSNASDDGDEGYVYIDNVSVIIDCESELCNKSKEMNNESQENSNISKLSIFPNPTSGELNIQLNTDSEESAFVQVYSLDAKLVSEKQAVNTTNKGITTINLSHLPQGIYYIELVQGEQVMRERVVVQ